MSRLRANAAWGVSLGLLTWATQSTASESSDEVGQLSARPAPEVQTRASDDEEPPTDNPSSSSEPSTKAPTSRSQLPANPLLTERIPPAPDAVEIPPTREPAPKVRFGINAGVNSRSAKSQEATYEPGITWGGHVGVVLMPWLALRATSQVTSHNVHVHDGAWGLSNPGLDPPHLRELALAGAFELRKGVAPQLDVFGGAGVAWTRLTMSHFILEQPWPVAMETRSGVTLELPFHAGVGYSLGRLFEPFELWLTLEFRYSPVLKATGKYFEPTPGESENVRTDTGARVEIGGLPGVSAARVMVVGVEGAFY